MPARLSYAFMRRVLITGIGVLSPNGIGKEDFQQALLRGESGIRKILSFDPSSLPSPIAGEVPMNGEFFSKKEKRNLPRVSQLSIVASDEAVKDAGIHPLSLSQEEKYRFGVVLGTGGGSIEFVERHYEMYFGKTPFQPSLYAISASTPGGLSSELSIRYGFLAKSHVITTGCTSSTDALGYAFHEIQAGRLDRALVGGADAPITPAVMRGFNLLGVLTSWGEEPARASRPFDRNRDGFVLSEGAWMFVLEDYDLAKKRGVSSYAEILGYGSSCEAFHPVRMNDEGETNIRALAMACEEAGISPDAIEYVNLHGTATPLNDRIETRAMKNYFGRRAAKIPMSSTKSLIGHPQGASGAAGLAATLLCMKAKKIHGTINLDHPDPECDLDYVAHRARSYEFRYALCNTLGFGSKSSALVIENRK